MNTKNQKDFETIVTTMLTILSGMALIDLLFGDNSPSKEFKKRRNYIDTESSRRANRDLNSKLPFKS